MIISKNKKVIYLVACITVVLGLVISRIIIPQINHQIWKKEFMARLVNTTDSLANVNPRVEFNILTCENVYHLVARSANDRILITPLLKSLPIDSVLYSGLKLVHTEQDVFVCPTLSNEGKAMQIKIFTAGAADPVCIEVGWSKSMETTSNN